MDAREALSALVQAALDGASGGDILRVYRAEEVLAGAIRDLEAKERALAALESRLLTLEARLRALEETRSRVHLLLVEAERLFRRSL
ncbi:hypothetical protein [Thermus hydrothermalis]|uniref:hypothetical protein n=1 Tax=Thermus hydrothermalis TaxID=2908148 RepID=UPI001FAAB0C6|nr:hypothetical protein [Thermus hydrothermalis]